jgi:hypothetical protein
MSLNCQFLVVRWLHAVETITVGWFEGDSWIIWRLVDLQPNDENVTLLVPGAYKGLALLA